MVHLLQSSNANTPLAPVQLARVVMCTVVACDDGMSMFVYTYVMEVPVINLAFY